MVSSWWALLVPGLLLLLPPPIHEPRPSAATFLELKLPLTRLIGEPLAVGAGREQALHLHIKRPHHQWLSSLPAAELRFSRAFAEKPVDLMAELSPRADFSSSSVRLYRDVEKIVLDGNGGDFYVRIWAELNGAVRPDLWDARRAWLATTRIAVIYEVLLGGGVPRSTLPVLALIVMALLTLYGWGISAFIHILNDSSTMNADQKTE